MSTGLLSSQAKNDPDLWVMLLEKNKTKAELLPAHYLPDKRHAFPHPQCGSFSASTLLHLKIRPAEGNSRAINSFFFPPLGLLPSWQVRLVLLCLKTSFYHSALDGAWGDWGIERREVGLKCRSASTLFTDARDDRAGGFSVKSSESVEKVEVKKDNCFLQENHLFGGQSHFPELLKRSFIFS